MRMASSLDATEEGAGPKEIRWLVWFLHDSS